MSLLSPSSMALKYLEMGPLGSSFFLYCIAPCFPRVSPILPLRHWVEFAWIRKMCAMYLEHSPPVIPQSSHSYVLHGVENCECFAFELVNVHPLFLLSGHHEALFSTLMLRGLFSSDFSCIIACAAFLKMKPWWFQEATSTPLLITRIALNHGSPLCKSLWIDEDETHRGWWHRFKTVPYLKCHLRGENAMTRFVIFPLVV